MLLAFLAKPLDQITITCLPVSARICVEAEDFFLASGEIFSYFLTRLGLDATLSS